MTRFNWKHDFKFKFLFNFIWMQLNIRMAGVYLIYKNGRKILKVAFDS